MDPRRVSRYVDKIDHARERLNLVEEWLVDAQGSIQARLATYKAFQEAAEAAADLAAMAVVDGGAPAKDDYTNFEVAAERGLVAGDLAPRLRECTGLRNRLVHEYEGVDDTVALESIRRLVPALQGYLEGMEAWMASRTG